MRLKTLYWIYGLWLVLLLGVVGSVEAQKATSSTFQLQSGSFSSVQAIGTTSSSFRLQASMPSSVTGIEKPSSTSFSVTAGFLLQTIDIALVDPVSVDIATLNANVVFHAADEVVLLRAQLRGDDITTLTAVDIKIADLSEDESIPLTAFSEFNLYGSSDNQFDATDERIGTRVATDLVLNQPFVITPTLGEVVPSFGRYYFLTAVLAVDGTHQRSFWPSFPASGLSTSFLALGEAIAANAANKATVEQRPATLRFSGLTSVFDNTPKVVIPITEPADLAVSIRYNGASDFPLGPGQINVTGSITDPRYIGSATAVMIINPPNAPVPLLTAVPLRGNPPLEVRFNDASTGFITSRSLASGNAAGSVFTDLTKPVTATYVDPGEYTAILTLTGPGGTKADTSVTILVNGPPVLQPLATATALEDDRLAMDLKAVDSEPGNWQVEGIKESLIETVEIRGDSIVFTPQKDAVGSDGVVFVRTNEAGLSSSFETVLTWTPQNDPPQISSSLFSDFSAVEDQTIHVGGLGSVTDVDTPVENLVWGVRGVDGDIIAKVTSDANGVVFTPQPNRVASVAVTVFVQDPLGAEATQEVQLNWTAVNDAPDIPIAVFPAANAVGISLTPRLTWQVADIDGDVLTMDLRVHLEDELIFEALGLTTSAVDLNELQFNKTYTWSVTARDPNGLTATAEFTFSTEADTRLPLLSEIRVSSTEEQAIVTWLSDELATSHVHYGITQPDQNNGGVDASGDAFVTQHAVNLSNLEAGTWYQLELHSTDLAGNTSKTFIDSFLTLFAADTVAPSFLVVPTPEGVAQESMVIRILADELVTANVLFAAVEADLESGFHLQSAAASETHNIPVDGLNAATSYQFKVILEDAAGNVTASAVYPVKTLERPDETAPINVVGPSVRGITDTEATIDVQTDEPCRISIRYGLEADLIGSQLVQSDQLKANQLVILTGLPAATEIFFAVEMIDASDNKRLLAIDSFFTTAEPDITAPQVVEGPTADAITDHSFVLTFKVDEPARVRVILTAVEDDGGSGDPLVREFSELHQAYNIKIDQLVAGTSYFFELLIKDNFNNSRTVSGEVQTGEAPDILPPQVVVGPFMEGIESFSATVGWGANELSTATVRWSRTNDEGVLEEVGKINISTLALEGSVRLTGLEPGVEYQVDLKLLDAQGNASNPVTDTFTSALVPDTLAPILLLGPDFQGITSEGAQIIVEYDEPVDIVLLLSNESDFNNVRTIASAKRQSSQRISLTNLAAGTIYFVTVRAQDAAGNTATAATDQFITQKAADIIPPNFLFQPRAKDISTARAQVEFQLDEPGDLELLISPNADLSEARIVRDPTRRTNHVIEVRDLTSGTTFFGQLTTKDGSGNVSVSTLFNFSTLEEVVLTPPLVTNGPIVRKIRETGVEIFWRTNVSADATVDFYRADQPNEVLQVGRGTMLTEQVLVLNNLIPETKYHFSVSSRNADRLGSDVLSSTFITAAEPDILAPLIQGSPTAQDIKDTQVLISWITNESADSKVFYRDPEGAVALISDPVDVSHHSIRLTNLLPATRYAYWVSSTDQVGNGPVLSKEYFVTTAVGVDITPPEFTVAPNIVGRSQTTIALQVRTNEPTLAQVRYGTAEGGVLGTVSGVGLHTDQEVLISGLKSNTLYWIQVLVTDSNNNGPTIFGSLSIADFSIATLEDEDEIAPLITSGPLSVTVTQSEAVIQWSTNEPADGVVTYVGAGEERTSIDPEYRREHSHVISELKPGTTYTIYVASSDIQRNGPVVSAAFSITTETEALPLNIIAGPTALDLTADRATIVWTTDKPANTILDYGTDITYGEHVEYGNLVQHHSLTLTGLAPATTFHFSITSRDLEGNVISTNLDGFEVFSFDHQFATLAEPDTDPPIFVKTPTVEWTDATAVVSWETNELSTSRIDWAGGGKLDFIETSTLEREHSLTLTGLEKRTNYFFRIASIDAAGNELVWGVEDVDNLALLKIVPVGEEDSAAFKPLQPPGGGGRFITNNFPDTQFPVILSGPHVVEQNTSSLTLEWETDEAADSFVRYTLEGESKERNTGSAGDVVQHRVTLTNLTPGQQYNYIVASTDPSGNGATESARAITATTEGLDLTPPRFLEAPVLSSKTNTSLTLRWRTDESALAIVEYFELGEEVGKRTRRFDKRQSSWQINLNNLEADTEYVVRVFASDVNQNTAQAPQDLRLRTDVQADLRAPQIIEGPEVEIEDRSATITWITDENADSFVDFSTSPYRGKKEGSAELVTDHRVVLTNLLPNMRYFYVVGSTDRSGNGPSKSRAANFRTLAQPRIQVPVAPENLRVTSGFKVNLLEWDAVEASNLSGYTIYRERLGQFTAIATNITDTLFFDRSLINDRIYRYQVTAVDRQLPPNESEPSASVAGTPSATGVPTAPTVLHLKKGAMPSLPVVVIENARTLKAGVDLTYTIQVSTGDDFRTVVDRTGGLAEGFSGVTHWRVTRPLNVNKAYWWRVKAFDGQFEGPWSEAVSMRPNTAQAMLASDDFNDDGVVSFGDFFMLAHGLGGDNPTLDIDLNGRVDEDDFETFAAGFGQHGSSKPGAIQRIGVVEEAFLEVETQPEGDDEITVRLRLIGSGPLTGFGLALSYDPFALDYIGRVDSVGQLLSRPDLGLGLFYEQDDKLLISEHVKGRLQPTLLVQDEIVRLRFTLGMQRHLAWLRIEDGFISRGGGNILRIGQLGEGRIKPRSFGLFQNYPNPFNPSTAIPFAIPAGMVKGTRALTIYNALGQLIRTWDLAGIVAGYHVQQWDGLDTHGREVGSGIYLIRLNVDKSKQTRKILLVR